MIHNRLALFRTEKNLSRAEVANLVGVNPQTIGFLERGAYCPSVELSLKLAKALDARVEDLFSLESFPPLSKQLEKEK